MKGQSTSRQEIENLLGIVERDRSQADLEGLHPDIQFELLYNAALQLATIILRLSELRISRAGHHKETFRAVQELVPANLRSTILHFDQARRKRNSLIYDQAGTATAVELTELRNSIDVFEKWVRKLASEQLR
ncbi:hypothetical protein ACFLS5_02280 [Candidatus Bipolaricaulota bacterium]